MKAKILVFAKVFTPPASLVKGGIKNTICISSRDAPILFESNPVEEENEARNLMIRFCLSFDSYFDEKYRVMSIDLLREWYGQHFLKLILSPL